MGIAKDTKNALVALATAAEKLKNAELKAALAEVKLQVADLLEETGALRERVRELEHAAERDRNFVQDEAGTTIWEWDGMKMRPYCMTCWDKDGKAIRLTADADYSLGTCGVCKYGYQPMTPPPRPEAN